MDLPWIFHGFPHLWGPGDLLIPRLGRRLGGGRRPRDLRAAAGAALRGRGGHRERGRGGAGGQHGDLDRGVGMLGCLGRGMGFWWSYGGMIHYLDDFGPRDHGILVEEIFTVNLQCFMDLM